ncbi:transcription intermediary factor 1-beta-like [Mya arenaria]|nr:transcription intermediary factor 1-beta-like [Mya arenaria]
MAWKHRPLNNSVSNASDEIHDFSCSACKDDNLNIQAKHFCGDCSNYYCDKCLKFHAKIHKPHVVFGRKDVDKWVVQGDALVTCDLHPPTVLELLCEDHAELCCHLCVSLNHRMCKRVDLISDLAKGMHKMADFKQLPANVTKVTASLNQVSEARKKNQNSLKISCKSMLTKIKSFRSSLNELLDELEKRTVEQMDSVLAGLDWSLQKDIDHCDLLHDQLKALLDSVQAHGKESRSFIGYRKCKDKMAEGNRLLREMNTKQKATITFQPDTRAQHLLSDIKTLGNIKGHPDPDFEQSSGQIKQSSNKPEVFKVKQKKTYAMNIKNDKQVCCIDSITELPGGEIVLVDNINCRVKVLDSEYKVTAHCDLPEFPQDICNISDHEVAVAFKIGTDRNEAYFLTVSADNIKMTRKFSVDHSCNAIKHHEGELYVGSVTALYLYTLTGRLQQKVYEDTSGEVTVNGFDLSSDGMKLYIPVSSYNKVNIIDKRGNILATLQDPDFDWPYSVHVSGAGHVFVCSLKSKTVVQIDQEGRKKLATLVRKGDSINKPKAVLHSTHTGRLIVGGAQNDILVMELQ